MVEKLLKQKTLCDIQGVLCVSTLHVYRLQCPVSLKTVQDGDHRLSRPQDIELITSAVTELLTPPNALGDSTNDTDD